jgi:hypothetical protein
VISKTVCFVETVCFSKTIRFRAYSKHKITNKMFTPEQIEQAKKLDDLNVENVVENILKKTEYELKYIEAEKEWPYKFSLEEFQDFMGDAKDTISDKLNRLNDVIQDAYDSFYKEVGVDNKPEEEMDEFPLEYEEQILTHLMHQKYPSTKKRTFTGMEEQINNLIESQNPPIITYIQDTLIPMIEESRNTKKQRLIE